MHHSSAYSRVMDALERVGCRRPGKLQLCPAHDDHDPSLLVTEKVGGEVKVRCFAGCSPEEILAALGLTKSDLAARGEGAEILQFPPPRRVTGLTVREYAEAKGLPEEFLRKLGLSDFSFRHTTSVRIPYRVLDDGGPIRFRLMLEKGGDQPRFKWRAKSKAALYGTWSCPSGNPPKEVFLVEGESDVHTLLFHGQAALGVPGADTWRNEWSSAFERIEKIYAVVEADKAGGKLRDKLMESPLRDRLHFVHMADGQDVSSMYLADRKGFPAALDTLKTGAVASATLRQEQREAEIAESWPKCQSLATQPRILDEFLREVRHVGLVGEDRAAQLVFLAMVSRHLERPISLVLKGASASGKSFTTETVLKFFPESGALILSGMSEKFLAYTDEPLAHRMIVVAEAAGLGEHATYMVRTLLSEGRVRWATVEKGPSGSFRPRMIEREGPAGVLLTTTAPKLHGENETRLLSVPVDDTQSQTKRVMRATARENSVDLVEFEAWHALSAWIGAGVCAVTIPFGDVLAEIIEPVAVRIRRDFRQLLMLVSAHALLHRANREERDGTVVATLDDYSVVRELVRDLLSDAAQSSVPRTVRETVDHVAELLADGQEHASVTEIAEGLGLCKSSASRRVRIALDEGYLENRQERKGREYQITLARDLPEDVELLPTAHEVESAFCGSGASHRAKKLVCFDCGTRFERPPDAPPELAVQYCPDCEAARR